MIQFSDGLKPQTLKAFGDLEQKNQARRLAISSALKIPFSVI
jgi:hypothetical protein